RGPPPGGRRGPPAAAGTGVAVRKHEEPAEKLPSLWRIHPVVLVVRVALAVAAARHGEHQQRPPIELRRARVAEAEPGAGADSVPLLVVVDHRLVQPGDDRGARAPDAVELECRRTGGLP